jgi:flagellar motor protein MotB
MITEAEQTNETAEEGENYFISMTDMMVGMLFIFIIMLMVFALNFRVSDDDSQKKQDCLTDLLTRNARLTAEINDKVNRVQDSVRSQIEALEFAADQRRKLLTDIKAQLANEGLTVDIDERNGVLRLTEQSVRFDPDRADLNEGARENVRRIARVLGRVVPRFAACTTPDATLCSRAKGAALETIFIEGHTDITGVPNASERDRRNWQLSTDRAVATFRTLVAESPELRAFKNRRGEEVLSVSGYSSTRPIVEGDTREAFARNRRIDLRFVMDADTTINLREIILLNDEVKQQIARLAAISQESAEACR